MVDKIFDAKAKILERMEKSINERGVDRLDIVEMEKLADIVKDLSEAEKECWEAEYYRSVTEAMGSGSMGYEDAATRDRRGYAQGPNANTVYSGYSNGRSGYRDSMGRFTQSRGYGNGSYGYDPMQGIREAMSSASAEERERMKTELRGMIGM